jgi:ABC-type nickel/cobalt efflux system permease component RcnA
MRRELSGAAKAMLDAMQQQPHAKEPPSVAKCLMASMAHAERVNEATTMNKTWLGVIGAVLVILFALWLLGGTSITCHESFWDKDKQVIEIKRD